MSVKGQEETEITDSNPPPTTNIQDNIKGKVTSTCCILYSVYSPLDNVVTFLQYGRFFRRPGPLDANCRQGTRIGRDKRGGTLGLCHH